MEAGRAGPGARRAHDRGRARRAVPAALRGRHQPEDPGRGQPVSAHAGAPRARSRELFRRPRDRSHRPVPAQLHDPVGGGDGGAAGDLSARGLRLHLHRVSGAPGAVLPVPRHAGDLRVPLDLESVPLAPPRHQLAGDADGPDRPRASPIAGSDFLEPRHGRDRHDHRPHGVPVPGRLPARRAGPYRRRGQGMRPMPRPGPAGERPGRGQWRWGIHVARGHVGACGSGGAMAMKRITRRHFIKATWSAALRMTGAGLVSTAARAQAPVRIVFWHSMGGNLGETVVKAFVNTFNASRRDIQVEAQFQGTYDDAVNKLRASIQSSAVPAVAQVYDIGTRFMIDSKGIVPAQEFIDREKFDLGALEPNILAYYRVGDRLYSMPFNTSTAILYYNKDMYKKAGLDPNRPPRTFEDIEAFAKQLVTGGTGGSGITISIY